MGDYTKKGEKIGTCGQAYYATLPMLKHHFEKIDRNDSEVNYYLKPENKCTFAFPFPEYDGKLIGEISNFHEGQRIDYFISVTDKIDLHHKEIVQHLHPKGGQSVNMFTPCIMSRNEHRPTTSTNFNPSAVQYRLLEQKYYEGQLLPVVECVYCGGRSLLDQREIQIVIDLIQLKVESNKTKIDLLMKHPKFEDNESLAIKLRKQYEYDLIIIERLKESLV